MRSAIMMGLAVFLVMMACAMSMLWYFQARGTRMAVEQYIAQVNEKQPLITYEKIETTGFPREVKVQIVNPRFKGRVDELLKPLAAQVKNPAQAAQLSNLPEWTEDASLTGILTIGVNALSDQYSFSAIGNWQNTTTIGGKAFSTLHEQAGGIFCSLQMERGSLFSDLWNFHSLSRDSQKLLEDFRLFDCAFPASTMLEATSREKVAGVGAMRFYISSRPSAGRQNIRVYLSAPDAEITPRGDELFDNYARAFNPGQYQIPRRLSAYGKQRLDLDFTYNGPSQLAGAVNPELEVNLSNFSITNDAYNTQMHAYIKNGTASNLRNSQLSLRAESHFNAAYDTLLHEVLRTAINEVYTTPEARSPQMQPFINTYNQDQMYAILAPALPDFASLGKAVQSVDVHFKGTPDMKSGEVTLNNIEISFAPYGIHVVGTGKSMQGQPPGGQMQLTCTNCGQLIDDLLAYISRLYGVAIYFVPEMVAPYQPDPGLNNALKSFLGDLAGPDKTNLAYDIQMNQGGVTINGKPISLVTTKYYQYLAPYMKQYQPESAQPAPAPARKGPPVVENMRRRTRQ